MKKVSVRLFASLSRGNKETFDYYLLNRKTKINVFVIKSPELLMNAILIVDDEKNTREGLRLSLEDEFDVYISSNIKGAKDVLDNESIDVLVTDLSLIHI